LDKTSLMTIFPVWMGGYVAVPETVFSGGHSGCTAA